MILIRIFFFKENKRRRIEKSIDSFFERFCFKWGLRKGILVEEGYGVKINFLEINFFDV